VTVIRVLLADDHQLFREGLASILDSQPDFEVVGEAADGLEVFVKARDLAPDLILMDVGMPGCDGVEATQHIKAAMPGITIVMLTVRDEEEKLFEAIQNGAQGYLLKSIRSWDLVEMLRAAIRGEAAITPVLGGRILEEFRRLSKQAGRIADSETAALTHREQEVISLVSQGGTDQEIANQLNISVHTVKTHMRNILAKLQLSHRHEAALYAMREGLIPRSGHLLRESHHDED
jgi:DNA-binding NarL/FixJ family response regulator